mmetsp:Transcript_118560/g.221523  ORF Transcript_118560/g.221523 Transcript_118560/m.221523 type:complete len:210 (+) Transcript_118560:1189-1818(+)
MHHLLSKLTQEAALHIVVRLQEDVTQYLVAEGIVLAIESIKTAKCVTLPIAHRRHAAECIHTGYFDFVEARATQNLHESLLLLAFFHHNSAWLITHLYPDEVHQAPLTEACRVVDVCIHLPNLIPIAATMLLALSFSICVSVRVKVELQVQFGKSRIAERCATAVIHRLQDINVIMTKFLDAGVLTNHCASSITPFEYAIFKCDRQGRI